jgi:hypothetical protein
MANHSHRPWHLPDLPHAFLVQTGDMGGNLEVISAR